MQRSSYLRQFAPQPPAPRRGGIALLAPPPLLFRPAATAPELVETETSAVQGEAADMRAPAGSRRPPQLDAPGWAQAVALSTTAPADRLAPAAVPSTVRNPPAAAQMDRPAQLAEPAATLVQYAEPATAPPLGAPVQHMGPGGVSPAANAWPLPLPGPGIAAPLPAAQAGPGPVPAGGGAASARRTEHPPSPGGMLKAPAPIAPPLPLLGELPSAVTPPAMDLASAPPTIVPLAVTRAVTDPSSVAPPPLLVPPPAATPRLAVTRATAAPGLHIGTLEVRVVTPAPAPTGGPTRAAPRPLSRPAAGAGGRIARGFGVFGLGQS